MTLTASNAFINWHGVAFTPTGGTLTPINRVTSVKPDRAGTAETFKGDADVFDRLIAVPTQHRTLEIQTADVATCYGLAIGATGTVVATLDDMVNKSAVGGGGFTITLANATLISNPLSEGSHAKVNSATLVFQATAPDGVTDPLTKVNL